MTSASSAATRGQEEPLISIGEASLDRMPALALIFESCAAEFTRGLEELSQIPAAAAFEELEAKRLSELAESQDGAGIVLVYQARGLDARLAVAADKNLRDLGVELLLGSNMIESSAERPVTRVELRLIDFLVAKLLAGLTGALAPLADVRFERDFFGEEAGLAALGQKAAVAIVAHLRLKALERECEIVIALPRAALDPYRAELSRFPSADGLAKDERWSENLYDHIVRTEVRVDVKLEARGFTLDDIASLEVGDVVRLPLAPTAPIRVESEGRTLFWCTLGQRDGFYTVRLEEFSDERQSFIENILGV